ncbi:hypothetical protein AB0M43_31080 [Longispora sp. NPDC051575]|uniref:hypothetical protein n=1 Tax=Longispora sp. NPDC051575 TaxID=3154943 RepID=UPI003442340B
MAQRTSRVIHTVRLVSVIWVLGAGASVFFDVPSWNTSPPSTVTAQVTSTEELTTSRTPYYLARFSTSAGDTCEAAHVHGDPKAREREVGDQVQVLYRHAQRCDVVGHADEKAEQAFGLSPSMLFLVAGLGLGFVSWFRPGLLGG